VVLFAYYSMNQGWGIPDILREGRLIS